MRRAAAAQRAAAEPLSRDLDAARRAFETGNAELSRAAHAAAAAAATSGGGRASSAGRDAPGYTEPGHLSGDRSVRKSFIYAGVDGIAAACVLYAVGSAAGLDGGALLRVLSGGLAGLAAAATLREFQRIAARNSDYAHEHARERWELRNYAEGEIKEMREVYVSRGLTEADAASVVDILSRHSEFFVEIMMVQELGLTLVGAACLSGSEAWEHSVVPCEPEWVAGEQGAAGL